MNANAHSYPRLAAAGYVFKNGEVSAPGENGTIKDYSLLTKMEGRLSNIAYMAHAIDIFDTAQSNVAPNKDGTQQFAHLMNYERDLFWTGYIYVALRRFQREERNDLLRTGIGLLLAYEQGIMSGRDAVQALAPNLVQMHDMRVDDGGKEIERQRQLPEPA